MATLIDTLEHEKWVLKDWKVRFLLSEKVIKVISKKALYPIWYEDEVTYEDWMKKLTVCYNSVQTYHDTFGLIPQIGDRLYDEDLGLMVQDRSIDGRLKTITFTLTR